MSMPAEQLTMTLTLADLLQGIADAPDISIDGISSDSRRLKRGDLFLACAGINSHGIDYIEQAAAAGVAAIAWDSATASLPDCNLNVPLLAIPELAQHLGEIANRFNGHPSESVQVIGVTGTNGKTTVGWMIAQCFEMLGQVCGYVGTLGAGVGEIDGGQCMTTPSTVELHGCLADFRSAGATYAAIEVSSHALDQNRIAGVRFDTVLFTNLSRDHLDYHGDMRSYGEAKARLFLECNAKHRIINLDSFDAFRSGSQWPAVCIRPLGRREGRRITDQGQQQLGGLRVRAAVARRLQCCQRHHRARAVITARRSSRPGL